MKEEIPIECYVTREGNLVKFVRYEKIQELQEEIKRLKEEYMILQNASDEVEEELQDRIDKAIEFIKENENNISSIKDLENNKTYNSALLSVKDILQGVDKK